MNAELQVEADRGLSAKSHRSKPNVTFPYTHSRVSKRCTQLVLSVSRAVHPILIFQSDFQSDPSKSSIYSVAATRDLTKLGAQLLCPLSSFKMMPNPHVYGHHQYNPQADATWLHQQPNHHQHAQQQAAAAAVSAAQQQHYSRIATSHGTGGGMSSAMSQLSGLHSQDGSLENVSEDNRRTLAYIADLLNESTREAALLELSKKREQVPELALILWHSFGMCSKAGT
jgi:hypothetical protein